MLCFFSEVVGSVLLTYRWCLSKNKMFSFVTDTPERQESVLWTESLGPFAGPLQ